MSTTPCATPRASAGEIQPDLDTVALKDKFDWAAELSASAVLHETWDHNVAVAKWGDLFGPDFPPADGGGGAGAGGGGGGGLAGLGVGTAGKLDIPERIPKDIHQG